MDEKKALAVLEKHKGDLVYVRPEDLQTQRMFVPQVTVIEAVEQDFHNIKGKMMPKSHHLNRIGEAAGVDFVFGEVEKLDNHTWVGRSQGRRRQPDGSWRKSNICEYEFDAEVRAETDAGATSGKKYQDLLLEYRKFGRQRAESGAKARVIRELVGIPTAFDKENFQRAMVVSRIAINTDELLDNPETRKVAIEAAMNGAASIYGPKDVTPDVTAQIEAPEAVEEDDDFATFDQPNPGEDKAKQLRIQLEDWLLAEPVASSKQAAGMIRELLANESATVEEMQALIERCRDYAAKKSGVVS